MYRFAAKALSVSAFFLLMIAFLLLSGGVSRADEMKGEKPLSFALGKPGKTGCMVCHGDPKISRRDDRKKNDLYISDARIADSVHGNIACVSCHTDFKLLSATKDHTGKTGDYRTIAGLSCKNCHDHSKQLLEYSQSIHGKLALSGDPKKGATCADCHGSHDIKSLKNKEYREQFHLSGLVTCGKCHEDYTDSYNDYYHGKAYHQKAQDAPACWDCHDGHKILSSDTSASKTSKEQLARTCGKCHIDSREGFATQYGKMIHKSKNVISENIMLGNASKIWSWVSSNVIGKVNEYYDSLKTSLFHRESNDSQVRH